MQLKPVDSSCCCQEARQAQPKFSFTKQKGEQAIKQTVEEEASHQANR